MGSQKAGLLKGIPLGKSPNGGPPRRVPQVVQQGFPMGVLQQGSPEGPHIRARNVVSTSGVTHCCTPTGVTQRWSPKRGPQGRSAGGENLWGVPQAGLTKGIPPGFTTSFFSKSVAPMWSTRGPQEDTTTGAHLVVKIKRCHHGGPNADPPK